jgi:phosphatidylethanolamine/phosphatidyl-N-methylethanolamine N-methyltransferase
MDSTDAQRVADADLRQFFRSWVQDPLAIGAVAPSGQKLARLMVADLHPGARVMELGAGTGTVTQAILERGVAPSDLYLVERDERFARLLERRFPGATLLQADATALGDAATDLGGSFDFIISGLPLVLFSNARKRRLLSQIFDLVSPSGAYHQFTYGGFCSIRRSVLRSLGLKASLIGVAPINVPPAFVYRIRREG